MSSHSLHRPVFADHASMLDGLMAPGRLILDIDGDAHLLLGFVANRDYGDKATAVSLRRVGGDVSGEWRPDRRLLSEFRAAIDCVVDGEPWYGNDRLRAYALIAAIRSEGWDDTATMPVDAIEPMAMPVNLCRGHPVVMHEIVGHGRARAPERLGLVPVCRVETVHGPGVFCLTQISASSGSADFAIIDGAGFEHHDIVGVDDGDLIPALRTHWANWEGTLEILFSPHPIDGDVISRLDRAPEKMLAWIAATVSAHRALPELDQGIDLTEVIGSAERTARRLARTVFPADAEPVRPPTPTP